MGVLFHLREGAQDCQGQHGARSTSNANSLRSVITVLHADHTKLRNRANTLYVQQLVNTPDSRPLSSCSSILLPPAGQRTTHLSLGKGFTLHASSRNLTTSTCPVRKAGLWVYILTYISISISVYIHTELYKAGVASEDTLKQAAALRGQRSRVRSHYLLQLRRAGLFASRSPSAPYPFPTEQIFKKIKKKKQITEQSLR